MNKQQILSDYIDNQQIHIKNSQSAQYCSPIQANIQRIYHCCLNHASQLHFIDPELLIPSDDHQQQADLIQLVIRNLLQSKKSTVSDIQCTECINYQSYLQKLENDVRQHIRLEHQLKLYQQSLEQKIEEMKKESKDKINTLNELKQEIQQYKNHTSKIQPDTDRTRLQRNKSEMNFNKIERASSIRKSFKHFHNQGKQNVSVKNRSISKQSTRKSVQKKNQKDKFRSTLPMKSNKQIPLTEKLMNKNKEEKKKAIQAKFIL